MTFFKFIRSCFFGTLLFLPSALLVTFELCEGNTKEPNLAIWQLSLLPISICFYRSAQCSLWHFSESWTFHSAKSCREGEHSYIFQLYWHNQSFVRTYKDCLATLFIDPDFKDLFKEEEINTQLIYLWWVCLGSLFS